LHTYLGLRQTETVLIVTDTLRLRIAKSLYDTARENGLRRYNDDDAAPLPSRRRASSSGAEAMRSVDVVIAPTTMSLTHTRARKQANDAGVRTASMPGVHRADDGRRRFDRESPRGDGTYPPPRRNIQRCVGDPTHVRARNRHLVRSRYVEWNLDMGCCRQKGCSTNLPAGEVYTAPENCTGTVVIDGSMAGLELLKNPLKIRVEEGLAVDVQGDRAKEVLKIINPLGDVARNIAELGIGTNPRARMIGVVLEDEKVRGHCAHRVRRQQHDWRNRRCRRAPRCDNSQAASFC